MSVTSTLSVFILGIFVGVKVFSKLLSWLLNHYHPNNTFAVPHWINDWGIYSKDLAMAKPKISSLKKII